MFIDSHCHLDYFPLNERKQIIQNAKDAGVKIMQTIGTKFSESDSILEMIQMEESIYASIGTHPENVDKDFVHAEQIISLCCKHPKKITAIGETGLDYYHSQANKELQQQSFKEHIKAAQETGKVLIVHTRNADEDTLRILTEEKNKKDFKILMHCFTGGKDFAIKLLNIGAFISFSGIVTFKNAKDVEESMMITPIDRLLIETDSPFLAPVPMRGKRNEPAFVRYVGEFIAKKRELDIVEFCKKVSKNYEQLFL